MTASLLCASIGSVFARLSSTVSAEDLRAELLEILRTDNEFAGDRDLHPDIITEVAGRKDEVLSRCLDELDQLRRATRALTVRAIRFAPVIVLAAVLCIGSAVDLAPAKSMNAIGYVIATVGLLAFATLVLTVQRLVSWWRRREYAKLQAITTIRAQLRASIRESITTLVSSTRRWSNTFKATDAPALVEVDLKDGISSRTYTQVLEFVGRHDASAIGLAGARGAGKSTLMRQLCADRSFQSISIQVPAPVELDTSDLIRILHTELARSALAWDESRSARWWQPRRAPHHDLVTRALPPVRQLIIPLLKAVGVLVVLAGLLLLYLADRANMSAESYSSSRLASWHLGWTGILAFTGLCAVLGAVLYRTWQTFRNRTRLMSIAPTVGALARQQLQLVRWTTTLESTAKTSAKALQFGLEGQNKLARAERPQTPGEAVRAMREFLTQLHALAGEEVKILVCIDELDKSADAAIAVTTINGIKDLFHLTNVHVLVSVSTDALASFAARGVPLRDVFDSSFDTILTVAPLTFDECRLLVSRRAPGFPSSAVMFAYAWSGGNARDLIRSARACVELPQRLDEELPLAEVVAHVLRTDLLEVIDAALQKLRAAQLEDECELILAFKELIDDGGAELHEILAVALADAPLPTEPSRATEAQLLAAALDPFARIAGLTALLFTRPRTPDEWRAREVAQAASALSTARASLGSHPREVARLVNRAVQACTAVLRDDSAATFLAVPARSIQVQLAGNGRRSAPTANKLAVVTPGGGSSAADDPDAVPLLE